MAKIEAEFKINFKEYFARELLALTLLASEQLVELTTDAIKVTPSGRLLIRRICMEFDAYLPLKTTITQRDFSSVI